MKMTEKEQENINNEEGRGTNENESLESDKKVESPENTTVELTPEEEIELLKAKIEEQKDKYLRLYADFDNFRKRTAKERLQLIDTATSEIMTRLLPVIDDFERAVVSNEKSDDANQIKEGMLIIHKKLSNTLQSQGLVKMKTVGENFDADKHEAITEIEAGKDKKGKVVDELEGGYFLKDKIIRFAKVVVGK
jgi:molecular chaperone GrpE